MTMNMQRDIAGKILVVEDNDFIRAQTASYLTSAEYSVLEAADGVAALEKMDEDVRLCIVDVRMLPMDGFEFIATIRGEGFDGPVVLLTGDQNNDLLEKARQYAIDMVMLKPVQKDRLVMTVGRLLQRQA